MLMVQGSVISINFSGNAHSGWKVVDKYDKKNRTNVRALWDTTGDSLVLCLLKTLLFFICILSFMSREFLTTF